MKPENKEQLMIHNEEGDTIWMGLEGNTAGIILEEGGKILIINHEEFHRFRKVMNEFAMPYKAVE